MGLKDFQRECEKGLTKPLYLLTSKDEFLLNDAARAIKGLMKVDDFNFDDFDLSQSDTKVSAESLIELLNMVPFMGGKRTVFVRHAEKFSKKDTGILAGYASNPNPSSLLVLFALSTGSKKDSLQSLQGVNHIDLSLSPRELGQWVNSKAKGQGFTFSDEALKYLIGVVGDNLGLLFSEVSKFASLNKSVVELKDISDLVYEGADYGAFEVIAHIRRGDIKETFKGLNRLDNSLEPYQLLGALCWDYVMRPPRDSIGLRDALNILHESDRLVKRAALCSQEITALRLLKVIK